MTESEFRTMIEKAAKSFHKEKAEPLPEIGADFKIVKSTIWKSHTETLSKEHVDIIEKAIDLASNASKEYELLSNEIGDDFFKWYETDRPEEQRLEDYLNSLSKDDIVIIEGVMYAGRDYMISGMVHSLEKYMQTYDEGTVDHICGKAPLAEYLAAGLKMYR